MNEPSALKMAYNVGFTIEILHKCVKVLDSYRRYVKDDQVLNDVVFDLRCAIKKIEI
jgi:hypothetical protein